MREWNDL